MSKDSLAAHEKFGRREGLNFPLLSDPETVMMKAYGAFGEKVMYGKKTTGVIRSTVVIDPDGTVVKHWPRVAKAETHPAEVLAYLKTR